MNNQYAQMNSAGIPIPPQQYPRPANGAPAFNKVIDVSLVGGIIGLFHTPRTRLNEAIAIENSQGWRVVQIIPSGGRNILVYLLRFLLLLCTLCLYTTADGWYVVLEKA